MKTKMNHRSWMALGLMLFPALAFAKNGEVRKLDFTSAKEKATLTIFFEGKVGFRVFQSEKQGSVILEADNLLLPARFTKLLDSSSKDGPVMQVTPYSAGDATKPLSKFVLQLKEKVEISTNEVPGRFVLQLASKNKSAKLAPNKNKPIPKLTKDGWNESDAVKTRQSASQKSEETAKRLIEVLNAPAEEKVYFGSRVTFEGNEVDVHDIFRLVGDASELNIMTDSDVKYKSNFSVFDIPWDQLLDLVLDQAQLKAAVKGNVVRIVTADRYNKELEAKLREIEIANDNEPVVMAVIPLSFATAEEMSTMLTTLLVKKNSAVESRPGVSSSPSANPAASAAPGATPPAPTDAAVANANSGSTTNVKLVQDFVRGEIQVDSRSNSLVVTNTRQAIERIKRLVKELDVALPQVLIDAKVVIASEGFTKDVGVTWGARATSTGSGRAGAALAFNGAEMSLGDSEEAAAFSVAGGAQELGAGFQVGAGRHGNLNAQLRLAEVNNLSKTVASPRVIVANKETATVVDGQTILRNTSAGANSNGAVEQIAAALNLEVTPQVTSVGSVLLKVDISKDSPSVAGVENKQIKTQVMVDSGSTLVLGGVYQNTQQKDVNGIPLLKDLPFIGQLFRRDFDSETKNELMVFITPEILDVKSSEETNTL